MLSDSFELKYDNLKSIQDLSESLKNSIENIIKTESYTVYNLAIRQINTGGSNFLGKLFEIDIKGDGKKETNLFVKQKLHFEKAVFVSPTHLYAKESFLYNELSEIFNRLQEEACVPPADRFKLAKAYCETNSDIIILENLSVRGFKTYDRMEALPLKYIELAVQQIAKFHGLSFIMEKKMPDYHDKNIKVLENPLQLDEDWNCFIRKVIAYVTDLCEDKIKAKVENFNTLFFENFYKYRTDKTSVKCTLSHGDYRSTNILVRQDNGELVEIIVVDYQFMDYGCPLRDLFYIICANTDQELRRNHMNDLKELYFKTLSKYLKYFDMDVETVYPRREFELVFSEWLIYGLMMTISTLPVLYAPANGIDFTTGSLSELNFSLDENIQDRVRKLIQDFVDWGYL